MGTCRVYSIDMFFSNSMLSHGQYLEHDCTSKLFTQGTIASARYFRNDKQLVRENYRNFIALPFPMCTMWIYIYVYLYIYKVTVLVPFSSMILYSTDIVSMLRSFACEIDHKFICYLIITIVLHKSRADRIPCLILVIH